MFHVPGVEVHARSTQTGCSSIFRADAVVLSVPLGVLKANVISFHPPLPEWKTQAIHNLGFGLLNKVGVVSSKWRVMTVMLYYVILGGAVF